MKELEYFIPQLNGWIPLSLEDYLSLLFPQEDLKFSKIKIPKGLPLCPKDPSNLQIPSNLLLPGNFLEIKISQNIFLETNKKNGRIQLPLNYKNNLNSTNYDTWIRAKIISYDSNSRLLFVGINDNMEIIDNFELLRPLKEIKPIKNDLIAYNIKQISNSEYEKIKSEFDKKYNTNPEEDDSNINNIHELIYDNKNTCISLIGSKESLRKLSILKQYEERYKKNISEEPNTNSDFSYTNSNNNLIGIKSSSGRSFNSENNSSNKNIIIKDDINNYKFKETFTYKDIFKKDIQKEAEELIQNCRYFIAKKNDNNFDLIIYGNDEKDFNEEKNIFEKEYKQVVIESDVIIDKKTIDELALKTKIKFYHIERKNLYLIGEEKNINDFKIVWDLKKDYTKQIQKESKERDNIEKELNSLKKKHKIKK